MATPDELSEAAFRDSNFYTREELLRDLRAQLALIREMQKKIEDLEQRVADLESP